jgi:hypothetical protein
LEEPRKPKGSSYFDGKPLAESWVCLDCGGRASSSGCPNCNSHNVRNVGNQPPVADTKYKHNQPIIPKAPQYVQQGVGLAPYAQVDPSRVKPSKKKKETKPISGVYKSDEIKMLTSDPYNDNDVNVDIKDIWNSSDDLEIDG